MSIGTRLKKIRMQSGISLQKLADMVKVSRASVSQWELEKTEPDGKNLLLCSLKLRQNPFLLQFGEDSKEVKEATEIGLIHSPLNSIPIYEWDNIGNPNPKKTLISPVQLSGSGFALRVEDDSMTNHIFGEPSFPRGTIIIIDPDKKPEHGKFVIARPKDRPDMKPLFRRYSTDYKCNDLFPLTISQAFRMQNADEFDILGVVVACMYLDL